VLEFFIMKRTIVLAVIIGMAVAVASYSPVRAQAPKSVTDGVYTAEQSKRGESLYAEACAACHDAKLLGGIGPALAGKDFIGAWKDKTVADLFTKTKVEMPLTAPGTLTAEQTADLVALMLSANQFPAGATPLAADAAPLKDIRMAEPGAGGAPASGAATTGAPAGSAATAGAPAGGGGLYADAQAKRAEKLYAESCGACHGATLGGDVGPALAGPRFSARWKDKSVAELFEKIQATMPASAPGSLTPEQTADLVALVLSTNRYPGGATELTGAAAPQKKAPLGDPPQK
jgi:mono/diheme cytochrome c family protein